MHSCQASTRGTRASATLSAVAASPAPAAPEQVQLHGAAQPRQQAVPGAPLAARARHRQPQQRLVGRRRHQATAAWMRGRQQGMPRVSCLVHMPEYT